MTFYTPSRPAKTIIDRAPILFPMLYTTCGTCHKILLNKIACMHACMHVCISRNKGARAPIFAMELLSLVRIILSNI